MKRLLIVILCVISICAAGVLLFGGTADEPSEPAPSVPVPLEEPPLAPFDEAVTLRVLTDGAVQELSLRDYLIGVLLAEMPTDFPAEALKAQAIASRTFALRQAQAHKHDAADICTDPACCQGFIADASAEDLARAEEAVMQTDGLVMLYEGALIDATFFSCSGGRTEAAVAVWGGDVPYLRSVESPGEEDAPRYEETVTLSAAEFAQTLCAAYPEANLAGEPKGWFGACSYTEGGGIETVFIGGTAVSGTQLRRLFSLRSTDITVSVTDEDEIMLTTRGFGHRVGLSQYGAKAMAESGKDFAAILTHYYTGANVTRLLVSEQPCYLS